MKMNLLGCTYKIYNSGYNTEMINNSPDAKGHIQLKRVLASL